MYTLKGPTDESDIDTAFGEGSTLSGPPETVLENPGIESGLGLGSQPQVWIRNALENVVIGLGNSEDRRLGIRDPPGSC